MIIPRIKYFAESYEEQTKKNRSANLVGAGGVVGSIWACYKKYSQYLEDGGSSANKQLRIVEQMTRNEDSSIQLQNMLEDIF